MQRCLLLVILLLSGLAAAQPIQLTTGEWPPFHGERLPYQGVATRIVSEAFALEGIEVQWQFLPWARALQMAALGQRSGSAVWRRNPERERLFFYSEPILTTQNYLFHRKQLDFDWQTLADLRGLRLGATRGYFYGHAFEQAEAAGLLNVQRINSDEVAFRQLLGGRIDLFPLSRVVALHLLSERFTAAERARLSFHPKPLSSHRQYLLLSRQVEGNAALIQRFNRGLARLQASGKVARYLLEVQQPLSLAP
ncbi:substrate-binding periplasmic protein [Pseudomonas zhanjiangensis]|uniref:Substrate-binding periplasmic protein n=1 Tax=Pseudomonas zhanjiangensis TaxID=3239015 RepID=A0ABV3YXS7_9PSED